MLARYLFHFHQLRRNLYLNPSKLQKIQRKKLRAIIKHAYENVPFYHRKFDKAGIKPDDIKSVDDLSKVPMTTKFEIQGSSLEDIVARNIDVNRCVKTMTSGSMGLPLTVIVDKRTEDFRGALWARAFWENGLRIRDRIAIIRDPYYFPKNRGWFERLGFVRRRLISIFDDAERQLAALEDFKPDVIRGYPSSLAILADVCRRRASCVKPRLVFTGSELLTNGDRNLISSVFECEPLDYYACIEFSLLMWECHEHTGFHINTDGAVFEFLQDEESVAPGECGEIVCTGLANYAMPLLRYRLGDEGIPIEGHCSCGRSLPLMKMMEGRTDDFLTALDGRRISPLVFSPYPFENLERIKQFRVIQEKRNRLKFQLVLKEKLSNQEEIFEKARRKIKELFGEGMCVDFQILPEIDRNPSGKLRKVISRVPPSKAHKGSY